MKNNDVTKSGGPRTLGSLRLVFPMLVAIVVILGGCTMTETEQRTASGAGIGAAGGAALGAIIGAFAGAPGAGAAIGAGAGAAVGGGVGYIVDQRDKRQAAEARTRQLEAQNQKLKQQNQY
jgi:hypothetical protein